MWKQICVVLMALLAGNSLTLAGSFGPPQAAGDDREPPVAVSAGYYRSRGRFEAQRSDWDDATLTQDRVYLQVACLFDERWEGYWRIGGANMKARDVFTGSDDFRDGYRIYTSLGARGLLYEMPRHHLYRLGMGPFLQAGFSTGYRDREGDEKYEYDNIWDVNLGWAAQLKLARLNDTLIYGGPFLYYAEAEATHSSAQWGSDSSKYEEKGLAGVFAGLRIPLPGGFHTELEAQYKSRFSAGLMLTKSF